jgi:hypothetical protein
MSDLGTAGSAAEGGQRAVDEAWVVRRAGELLSEGDPRHAREIVRDALDSFGRQAELLWILAEAEFAAGDLIAGREYLDEALAACQGDPASVARQIRTLCDAGFWREALSAVQAVPGELREDPLVRAESGNFYRACLCSAHAVISYGMVRGLPRPSRMARRSCWLRSGGPFGRLRRKVRAWEEMSLQDLRYPPGYIASISAVDGRDYRYTRRWYGWLALHRAGYRLIPLAVIPVWLVLLAVVSLAGFATDPAGVAGFAAVAAVVATIPVIAAVRMILWPTGQYRLEFSLRAVTIFLFVVMAAEAAAGEGYARHVFPSAGFPAAVVLGLVVIPAAVACLAIAWAPVAVLQVRWYRRMRRQDVLLLVIDRLLSVLHDLRSVRIHRGMDERLLNCRRLEYAARCLTRDLLPHSVASYLGAGEWLARRAAGWAAAIHHMQRQIVAPIPRGQSKLEAFLTHEIRCLVTGDLGALAWREPPPQPSRRTTLRQQAISVARVTVVAALPLIAVLAVQPFVHASSPLFNWARIATAIWALLYVLLSIDPTMRDKIGAARDLASLTQTAPRPASRDLQQ